MKITNVKYSASYEMLLPTGQSKWEKIGLEGELEENDTPEEGLLELKTIVEKFHEEHNPAIDATYGLDKFLNVSTGKIEY